MFDVPRAKGDFGWTLPRSMLDYWHVIYRAYRAQED